MKSKLLWLLIIPYALLSGLFYGLIAHKLVRDKEPWFTLLLIGGLAATITLIAWLGGIPVSYAIWTFIGSAALHMLLRLLFGKGSALEMISPPHIIAVLALLAWPEYLNAKQKAAAHSFNPPRSLP